MEHIFLVYVAIYICLVFADMERKKADIALSIAYATEFLLGQWYGIKSGLFVVRY